MRRRIATVSTALVAAAGLVALAPLGAVIAPAAAQQAPAKTPPTVTTGAATVVGPDTASVSGTVNPNGKDTTYAFQFGPTTQYGLETVPASAGSGSTPTTVTGKLTGLQSGTTYHYRVIASNADGQTVGADATFVTTGTPAQPNGTLPVVSQANAVNIGTHGAQLNGVLNPEGQQTKWWFEYGLDDNYGTQTAPGTLTGLGARPINAQLSGLQSGTTYHFRLVAQSGAGLYIGPDHMFTTKTAGRVPAKGLTEAVRTSRGAGITVAVSGRVLLPSGVKKSAGCRGFVTVQIKRNTSTLSARRAKVGSNCGYSASVHIGAARLRGAKTLRVFARFGGNAAVGRVSAGPRTVKA